MSATYTQSFKQRIVDLYNNGTQAKKIYQKNNIPRSTLYYWLKQHKVITHAKTGKKCATARDIYELNRKIDVVKQENEILKNLECSIISPQKEKLVAISKLDGQYPIRAICRAAGVLHSTYYHYKLRSPEITHIQKEDEILKPVIKEIFELTKGRIGSKKIRILMKDRGYQASAKRIRRLLAEMNLVCRSRMKNFNRNFSKSSRTRKDHVKQQFNPPAPNMIWASDITYIRVDYKPYYLCVIVDLHSRKVVGYKIADNQDVTLVKDTLKLACDSRKPKESLIFHSDQGAQFTSYQFRKELIDRKIQPSYSRAGCPYDNAVVESFFRTFKEDEANHIYYKTPEDLQESVDEFIEFFNNIRPHNSLNGLTPKQKEESFYESYDAIKKAG